MMHLDSIFHPGITVNEIREERGMTPADLAAASGIPEADILSILHLEKDITEEYAKGLEKAFGIGAYYWLVLQEHYNHEMSTWRKLHDDRRDD
ncbi:MAG: helix-turn-helix domain-containing protein [Clostridia bacterium]|nr:helix-turn-helix domain-containing protein [Clostridia bacterium]